MTEASVADKQDQTADSRRPTSVGYGGMASRRRREQQHASRRLSEA